MTNNQKSQTSQNTFEKLDVWKAAHQLVLKVYLLTKKFPISERYGLTSQLRRAGVSIASNIVEGNERNSIKEFIQFCYLSKASLAEVSYQLVLAKDLGFITIHEYQLVSQDLVKVGKLLNGLIKYLKKKNAL